MCLLFMIYVPFILLLYFKKIETHLILSIGVYFSDICTKVEKI